MRQCANACLGLRRGANKFGQFVNLNNFKWTLDKGRWTMDNRQFVLKFGFFWG